MSSVPSSTSSTGREICLRPSPWWTSGTIWEIQEDGGLSPRIEVAGFGELTISTHGRGEVVTGSVRVVSDGPIGGVVRFDIPGIGVAGVGASEPTGDALFPARRQAGGIRTAAAIHNLGMEAVDVQCRLMKNGAVLEERAIELDANGQDAQFIEELFTATDTTDFVGSVRCHGPARRVVHGRGVWSWMRTTGSSPPCRWCRWILEGGEEEETTLTFAHFANGTSGDGTLITSDLVLVNVAASTARPAIYFYDQRGELLEPGINGGRGGGSGRSRGRRPDPTNGHGSSGRADDLDPRPGRGGDRVRPSRGERTYRRRPAL